MSTQEQVPFQFADQDKQETKPKSRFTTRRKLAAAAIATGIALTPAAIGEFRDAHTTDSNAIEMSATTYPNPSKGAEQAIIEAINSGDPELAEAAKHIEKSELARAMADTVFKQTGESERSLSGIKTLTFKVEQDGDLSEVKMTKDTTNPDFKPDSNSNA